MSDRGKGSGDGYPDQGEEMIYGRHAVLEALRWSNPVQIVLADGLKGAVINEITLLARQRRVPVKRIPRFEFTALAGDLEGNQGVAAYVPQFEYSTLDRLIAYSRSSKSSAFLVMLDHIEDPGNFGAILRTADAVGVDGIIIPNQRAVGVTAAVRKVASGAAERMPVAMVSNLNQAAAALKKNNFWIYGAEGDGDQEYYRADYRRDLVLVLGSEGKGLSQLLRNNCDLTLTIPMPGGASSSLNVAAATAVLLYAVVAQREGWTF